MDAVVHAAGVEVLVILPDASIALPLRRKQYTRDDYLQGADAREKTPHMLHGKVASPHLLRLFEALPHKVPQVSEHEEKEPSAQRQKTVCAG